MSNPLVTIGMLSYNHAPFVGHAIESVLNQTYGDWELIIVDDASTDGSLDIIRRYKDPRIKLISHPKNLGPGATANTYLNAARGTWISILPSDDAYAPTRLAEQLAYLESHPDIGMVMTEVRFIDHNNLELTRDSAFTSGRFDYTDRSRSQWLRYFFDTGNCIPAASLMHHRRYYDQLGPMDHRLLQLQDYDYWLQMALDGCNFGIIHKPLTDYRIQERGRNLSAPSRAVYRRSLIEKVHVLSHFLNLTSTKALTAIFPELVVPPLTSEQEPVWVQHQLALHAWKTGGLSHRQFALQAWFILFKDQQQTEWLELWGMPMEKFYAVMTQNPLAESWCLDIKYLTYNAVMALCSPTTRQWGRQTIKRLATKIGLK